MPGFQSCRYRCGMTIAFMGKTGEPGSTGWFEVENGKVTDKEHTYKRCGDLITLAQKLKDALEKKKAEHGGGLDAFST